MNKDDQTLVNQCLSGDQAAFEQLVKRHSGRVFRIIQRFFHDQLLVEDIAQDVFIKVYTSLKTYSQKKPFENWLSKITVHACYRQLQMEEKTRGVIKSGLSPDDLSLLDNFCLAPVSLNHIDPERRASLRNIIDCLLKQLSPKERMILILTEVEGMSVKELSEAMGISPMNVKVSNFRARKHAIHILRSLSRKAQIIKSNGDVR